MRLEVRDLVARDLAQLQVLEPLDGGPVLGATSLARAEAGWVIEIGLLPVLPESHPNYETIPLGLRFRVSSAREIISRPSAEQIRRAITNAGFASLLSAGD